jgi:TonB family protein
MSVVPIFDAVAIDIAGHCDHGKFREEDRAIARYASTRFGDLLVVANGIGDDAGARLASWLAVDTISSSVKGMPAFFPPEVVVEEAVRHANAAIAAAAADPNSLDSRMSATVVVALLCPDADRAHAPVRAIIGQVGGCRAYLVHDRKLTLLTRDHSAVQDLPDNKLITPQEEQAHPASMLTPHLGRELDVQVEMCEVPLEVGDTLLLCSGGFWRYVSEQEIERILDDGARSAEEASRALLNLARDAAGHENVAIEIARLTQSSGSAAAVACAVEPRSETPAEITPVRAIAPASDTSQPARPNSPLILERVNSGTELQPPTVSWATPAPIAYCTGLSSVQLNATASVQGKFLYTPGPGYALPAGTHTLWVAFFAADWPGDNPVLAAVSITVSKATPFIQWPAPSHVTPGVALGAAQLNASAYIPGTFEYSPAAGAVLSEGTHTLSVTFNPTDKANYTTAQATVSVTVAKTVPEIDWRSPDAIPFGTPLGAALKASAPVRGTFEYSPAAGAVLSAESHTLPVTLTSSDGTSHASALATVSSPTQPKATAARQADVPLFRSFQSSIEVGEGQKTPGKKWMIASAVGAGSILLLLIFMILRFHSGTQSQSVQPPSAMSDAEPQSSTPGPSHPAPSTQSKPPAAAEATEGRPANYEAAAKPTQVQAEMMQNQLISPTQIPQGIKKQVAENAPPPANFDSAGTDGLNGSSAMGNVFNVQAQPVVRVVRPKTFTVSAGVAAGRLIQQSPPVYPPVAKAARVSGTVELKATISQSGTIKDLRVVSGPAMLQRAAMDVVRTWRYKPFTLDNQPTEVQTTIEVVFSLDK